MNIIAYDIVLPEHSCTVEWKVPSHFGSALQVGGSWGMGRWRGFIQILPHLFLTIDFHPWMPFFHSLSLLPRDDMARLRRTKPNELYSSSSISKSYLICSSSKLVLWVNFSKNPKLLLICIFGGCFSLCAFTTLSVSVCICLYVRLCLLCLGWF